MPVKQCEGLKRPAIALCLTAMLSACGPKVEDGIAAYRSGDFAKALAVFKRAADDPAALFYMHLMANSGDGVERDGKASLDYLRRAAGGRYPPAMHAFGSRLINVEKKFDLGETYLEAAIKAGEVEANVPLGEYYIRQLKKVEKGLARLHLAEATWLGKSVLASAYGGDGGYGIAIKPELSMRYARELVVMGGVPEHARGYARFREAENHYYGFGTKRDPWAAAAVLEPAIETNAWAKSLYGWLLFHGEGVAMNPERAVSLWQSIDLDRDDQYRYAAYGLGLAYATGTAVKKDSKKARELFDKSAILYGAQMRLMYATAKGFTGMPCDDGFGGTNGFDKLKGGRYESLAAKAYQAYGECMLSLAATEKDKVKRKYTLLPGADRMLSMAEQLGASEASALREQVKVARADGGIFIGMSTGQVLASKWGKPNEINRTQTADSVAEQWVYGGRSYLYFRNGVLEAIHN